MNLREAERFLAALAEVRAAGGRAAVATVVRVHGSAYRREGARMLVRPDGTYECALSGGCLEPAVADGAARVISTGEPALVSYDLADDSIWSLNIGCSGAVDIRIERIDGPHQPRPVSAERIDRGLKGSAFFVLGCAKLFQKWADDFQKHPNQLPLFDPKVAGAAGGDPNIVYYHSYWQLAPDEALVIDARPPECDYWNFQLSNHWLESLDYRYWPIHLNKATAKYRPDGSVRIVVAHEDPGVPNWLQTAGHERGAMCWRWIRAKQHPQPQARVVKLAELRGGAPA